jgi:hypothetical protein
MTEKSGGHSALRAAASDLMKNGAAGLDLASTTRQHG